MTSDKDPLDKHNIFVFGFVIKLAELYKLYCTLFAFLMVTYWSAVWVSCEIYETRQMESFRTSVLPKPHKS